MFFLPALVAGSWVSAENLPPAPLPCLQLTVWHKYAQYVTCYVAQLMFVSKLMIRDSHCWPLSSPSVLCDSRRHSYFPALEMSCYFLFFLQNMHFLTNCTFGEVLGICCAAIKTVHSSQESCLNQSTSNVDILSTDLYFYKWLRKIYCCCGVQGFVDVAEKGLLWLRRLRGSSSYCRVGGSNLGLLLILSCFLWWNKIIKQTIVKWFF